MSDVERKLARIKSADITYYNGPPLLTSFLHLEYASEGDPIGGTGQGFGGYGLDGEYAFKWINGIMECLGVDRWDQVPGKWVFVDAGWTKVERIISVETGKTFDPTLWKKEKEEADAEK